MNVTRIKVPLTLEIDVYHEGDQVKDLDPGLVQREARRVLHDCEDGRMCSAVEAFEGLLSARCFFQRALEVVLRKRYGNRMIRTSKGCLTSAASLIAERRLDAAGAVFRVGLEREDPEQIAK